MMKTCEGCMWSRKSDEAVNEFGDHVPVGWWCVSEPGEERRRCYATPAPPACRYFEEASCPEQR